MGGWAPGSRPIPIEISHVDDEENGDNGRCRATHLLLLDGKLTELLGGLLGGHFGNARAAVPKDRPAERWGEGKGTCHVARRLVRSPKPRGAEGWWVEGGGNAGRAGRGEGSGPGARQAERKLAERARARALPPSSPTPPPALPARRGVSTGARTRHTPSPRLPRPAAWASPRAVAAAIEGREKIGSGACSSWKPHNRTAKRAIRWNSANARARGDAATVVSGRWRGAGGGTPGAHRRLEGDVALRSRAAFCP